MTSGKVLQPTLEDYFRVEKEEMYYSILPSVTQYARNSLFAGLLPTEIEKKYPKYWSMKMRKGQKTISKANYLVNSSGAMAAM